MISRLTFALATLNVVLAMAIVLGFRLSGLPARPSLQAAPPVAGLSAPSSNPAQGSKLESPPDYFALPMLNHYDEIVARPLFNESRRPEGGGGTAAQEQLPFVVSGILVTPELQLAWITRSGEQKSPRRQVGDDIDGWTIQRIERDRVQFGKNGVERMLLLRKPLSPPGIPQ